MISFKMFKILFIVLLIVIVAKSGSAISCWRCNSHIDKGCESLPSGKQDKNTLPEDIRNFYVDCDSLNDSFAGRYQICRKQEQSIQDTLRIIRGCGIEKSSKPCYKTANPPVKTFVCQCEEDGCNVSSQLYFNQILVVISLFLSFSISANLLYANI
jgi:hypothetical protein